MNQKPEPDLKRIRCIQLAVNRIENTVQLRIDQVSK